MQNAFGWVMVKVGRDLLERRAPSSILWITGSSLTIARGRRRTGNVDWLTVLNGMAARDRPKLRQLTTVDNVTQHHANSRA